ncbi:unnamed protein product [Amoebophrya sp. A120]|nr:unnamed protein product [Amoebophrya sp. A120]|eukprot:GSA120T00017379001.1
MMTTGVRSLRYLRGNGLVAATPFQEEVSSISSWKSGSGAVFSAARRRLVTRSRVSAVGAEIEYHLSTGADGAKSFRRGEAGWPPVRGKKRHESTTAASSSAALAAGASVLLSERRAASTRDGFAKDQPEVESDASVALRFGKYLRQEHIDRIANMRSAAAGKPVSSCPADEQDAFDRTLLPYSTKHCYSKCVTLLAQEVRFAAGLDLPLDRISWVWPKAVVRNHFVTADGQCAVLAAARNASANAENGCTLAQEDDLILDKINQVPSVREHLRKLIDATVAEIVAFRQEKEADKAAKATAAKRYKGQMRRLEQLHIDQIRILILEECVRRGYLGLDVTGISPLWPREQLLELLRKSVRPCRTTVTQGESGARDGNDVLREVGIPSLAVSDNNPYLASTRKGGSSGGWVDQHSMLREEIDSESLRRLVAEEVEKQDAALKRLEILNPPRAEARAVRKREESERLRQARLRVEEEQFALRAQMFYEC